MRAGGLRHHLRIERPVDGLRDAVGQPTVGWQQYAETWGTFEELSGQELTDARQVNARIAGRSRTRYVEGITPDMRILNGSRTVHIVHVADREGREREHVLLWAEVQ